jgi:hypothetical protein
VVSLFVLGCFGEQEGSKLGFSSAEKLSNSRLIAAVASSVGSLMQCFRVTRSFACLRIIAAIDSLTGYVRDLSLNRGGSRATLPIRFQPSSMALASAGDTRNQGKAFTSTVHEDWARCRITARLPISPTVSAVSDHLRPGGNCSDKIERVLHSKLASGVSGGKLDRLPPRTVTLRSEDCSRDRQATGW